MNYLSVVDEIRLVGDQDSAISQHYVQAAAEHIGEIVRGRILRLCPGCTYDTRRERNRAQSGNGA